MKEVSTYKEAKAQACFVELASFLRKYKKDIEGAVCATLDLPPCEDLGHLHPDETDKILVSFWDSEVDIVVDGECLLASVAGYDEDDWDRDVPEFVDETYIWDTADAVDYLADKLGISCLASWFQYWKKG